MVTYRRAHRDDAEALIDLINYVFSFDHCPHDFKKMNPAMYNSDYPFWDDHYAAEENGKLLATLSISKSRRPNGLTYGHVGQVCVHPYHRGRGFMKTLMHMAIEDMKNAGFAFAELNGLRQRYEYFGFTQGNVEYNCTVTATNIRHIAPNTEGFTIHPLGDDRYEIRRNEHKVGSVSGHNADMVNPADIPCALCLYFSVSKNQQCCISLPAYAKERLSVLTEFCESIEIHQNMQYSIYRLRDVIRVCLEKRQDLWDGTVTIAPENETPFTVTAADGQITIADTECAETTPMLKLQRQLFGLMPSVLMPEDMAKTNWFPLYL